MEKKEKRVVLEDPVHDKSVLSLCGRRVMGGQGTEKKKVQFARKKRHSKGRD